MTAGGLSINQATTETSSTLDLLAAATAAGVERVAPWRHQYVEGDVTRTRQALDDHGIVASSLCRGGFFTGTRSRDEADADNRRAVEEAAILGAPVLVLVCGPAVDGDSAASVGRIRDGIERLLPFAVEHDVVLAVEPFHPMFLAERSAIVTLDQATDLVEDIDHPYLGIVVDTYHVWWDPGLDSALARAVGRTVGVHVADWLVPTPSLLAGRGLPGDGVIDLAAILRTLARGGYAGDIEVEVLNEAVWSRPAHEVVADIVERTAPLLAGAGVAA